MDKYFSSEFADKLLAKINDLTDLTMNLNKQIAIQDETISKLNETVRVLSEENTKLKEHLNKNSKNSSKPPSSDGFNKPESKILRKPSDKKQGAQNGYEGNGFSITKDPDKIVKHIPVKCIGCVNVGTCISCSIANTRYTRFIMHLIKISPILL